MSMPNNYIGGVLYGDNNFVFSQHMNFGAYILNVISTKTNKISLTNACNGLTDEKLNRTELAQQIVNVASSLERTGVRKGDVVAICSENRPEFLIATISALCCGAVVTFLNSAYNKDEMIHTVAISKPKYMFLSQSTYNDYYRVMKDNRNIRKFYIFGESKENATSFGELKFKYTDKNAFKTVHFQGRDEVACILYSSGTTGLPKGAMLTHRNLIASVMQPPIVKSQLNYFTVASWSNNIGLVCTLKVLIKGSVIIYLNKFNERDYLRAVEKHKAGFLMVVPPLLILCTKSNLLNNYDVTSIQYIHCGGAPLDINVINEVKKRFTNLRVIIQGYEMTETTGPVAEETDTVNKQGSVGKVVTGCTVKVVDVESRKILPPNEPGEVCVKGAVLFSGYVGKDMSKVLDEDGFYKSGDIAYYDKEGYFFITDRIKELIKYKAYQVAPSEIEGVILQHPAVNDVGVIGAPDDLAGELPIAFVVKKPGVEVTEKELADFVRSKVSHWKQLRGGVRFIGEIPKTSSGKILRRKLKERLILKPKSKL